MNNIQTQKHTFDEQQTNGGCKTFLRLTLERNFSSSWTSN